MHAANIAIYPASTQSAKHEKWGLFPQLLFWAYLFAVGTNLSPFPSDIDAYAIREASGSSLTRVYFLLLLALSLFAVVPVSARVVGRIRQCAPMLLPLGFVLCIMFISTFLSPHMALGMRKLAFFVISNLAFVLIIFTAPDIRSLIRSTGFFLAFLVLISLLGVFLMPERSIHQEFLYAGAWRGIFSHKNYTGATLCLAIYVFILCRQYGHRTFWNAMLVLSIAFMFMTQSKTSLAGLIIAPLFVAFLSNRFMRQRIPVLSRLAVTLFTVLILTFFLYSTALFELLGINSTLTGRLPLWDLVLRVTTDAPIIGHGFENFFNLGTQSALFSEGNNAFLRVASHSHNGYLNIYVYGGILGCIGIAWFFLALLVRGLRKMQVNPHNAFWLIAIIVFEMIRNITEVDIMTGARITWSLTLLAGAALLFTTSQEQE